MYEQRSARVVDYGVDIIDDELDSLSREDIAWYEYINAMPIYRATRVDNKGNEIYIENVEGCDVRHAFDCYNYQGYKGIKFTKI